MESPDTDTVPLALCSVHTFSPAAEFHCSDADQESESVVVAVGEGGGGRLWAFGEVAVTFHVPLYEALQPGQGPPAVAIPTPDDSIRTVASAPARANVPAHFPIKIAPFVGKEDLRRSGHWEYDPSDRDLALRLDAHGSGPNVQPISRRDARARSPIVRSRWQAGS